MGLLTFEGFAELLASIAYGVMVSIREHPVAKKIVLTHLQPLFRVVDVRSIAAFLLPFILYLLTAAPTIYNLDSAELTTAAATGGLVRATGYPLYLVLGRLWAFLPVGDVGFRLNLFSAFCGALTVFLAEHILRRLSVSPLARLGALGLLATVPYFWGLSLIAEVYTLHTALMAAVILALLRWGEEPTPRRFFWPVFFLALSAGNHAATVLLVPGFVWYVLLVGWRNLLQPRLWTAGILAALAGLSVFLYLPLAYATRPAFNYAGMFNAQGVFEPVNLHSLEGILWLVTGRSFAGLMFGYRLSEIGPQAWQFSQQLWMAFFAIGVGPGLLGLVVLFRRDWRTASMLLLIFAANAVFYINYRVIDKNTMYLPVYVVWALWVGVGYQVLLDWLPLAGRELSGSQRLTLNTVPLLVRGVMVVAVIAALAWNWSRVDLSSDWSTREQSEAILAQVEQDAIVFGWWETIPALQYLQLVEGERPDVLLINRFLISGDNMMTLIYDEAGERPVYINNPPLELVQMMHVTRVGDVYRVEPRP